MDSDGSDEYQGHPALDPTRERGILSEADRRYLLGESENIESNKQVERNTRSRIRDRVFNGLLDLILLDSKLSTRDRELIWEKSIHDNETSYFPDLLDGALMFLYRPYKGRPELFGPSLKRAILEIEAPAAETVRLTIPTVTFEVDQGATVDMEALNKKVQQGNLGSFEYHELMFMIWLYGTAESSTKREAWRESLNIEENLIDELAHHIEEKWQLDKKIF